MARPWKYDILIKALKDDEIYNTAKVIAECEALGLFDFSFDDETLQLADYQKKNAMRNARSSLAHYVVKYLTGEPDGYVEAPGRSRSKHPGWLGRKWKAGIAGIEGNRKSE